MNNFLWALKFLTIIPIDREDRIKPKSMGSVVSWFPTVGLCIGIFLSTTCLLFYLFFPPRIADALIIVVYIAITGAFHLDGFADTCDGIWGGRNKEKRLEIMKDSRIGSFGAVGLICLLGLKYISLVSIAETYAIRNSPFDVCTRYVSCSIPTVLMNTCAALMVMPVVGRWAQVCAAGLSSYARSESGTGSFILNTTTARHVIYTSFLPLLLLWFFYNLNGVMILAIIIAFTLIWVWYIKKKIGGMTGDTLGATHEIIELVFLLSVCLQWLK
ncbi:MAG: adenosylcobinamide-GDP ribazoletransferase [Candidatus Jettenia sp.]|nr:adenosylcobinamide-GDP ribazoletransferase [Candidatus Jettenia sp.]